MLHLDATATAAPLGWPALIDALRRAFAEGCEVPLRHTHRVDDPEGRGGTVLLMPAWRPGRYLGIKTVTIFPGNTDRALPGLHSLYTLFDARTGVPLAQLDGNEITSEQGWLYRVAANRAVDYWRRERRLIMVELDAEDSLSGTLEAHGTHLDRRAEEEQRMRRLAGEIRRLPKEQRMCVLLRSQGMRYKDIARILGVGLSTSADWLVTAVERLRKAAHE